MEIKCISVGDPENGFKNYFMHQECFDRLLLKLTNKQIQAYQLDKWQDYGGQQYEGRECVECGHALSLGETA